MGRKKWSVLRHLKKVVKKISFILRFKSRWRLASILCGASKRRCLSFNDRPGLHGCFEDEEDVSVRILHRARSYASEEDVDKRAEKFIANFYRQLRLERQVSLELRYLRGSSSSESDEANSLL